jgi:hypothetical protein
MNFGEAGIKFRVEPKEPKEPEEWQAPVSFPLRNQSIYVLGSTASGAELDYLDDQGNTFNKWVLVGCRLHGPTRWVAARCEVECLPGGWVSSKWRICQVWILTSADTMSHMMQV